MKTVVTGASGFLGKNLVVALGRAGVEVAAIDVDCPAAAWLAGVRGATVVFHPAGAHFGQMFVTPASLGATTTTT